VSESVFQFSEPAKLYAEHPDIPDIVEEMRQEAYKSLAEFRDALLPTLAQAVRPATLGRKVTYTVGQWTGAEIQYIWAGSDPRREWVEKVPMASFLVPVADKVKEERNWRDHLGVISKSVLPVGLNLRPKDANQVRRVREAMEALEFAIDWQRPRVNIDFDPSDPVGSAVPQIVRVLEALRTAANEAAAG
jgi:hypothetical protein